MPKSSKRKREEEISGQSTEALQKSVYDGAYELGCRYESGLAELKQDMKQAFNHYLFAAKGGHPAAQFQTARCYEKGEIVRQNWDIAIDWYKKAGNQQHLAAQLTLASCYQAGEGVAKDEKEAVNWYKKAAEQKNSVAEYQLGICYEKGNGVEKNESTAVDWYTKAANQGLPEAQLALGLCLYKRGTTEDKDAAKQWIKAAESQGNREARYQLSLLFMPAGRRVTRSIKEGLPESKQKSIPTTHSAMFAQPNLTQLATPAKKKGLPPQQSAVKPITEKTSQKY